MTTLTIHEPDDAVGHAQATLILAVLGDWLASAPGRRLTVVHTVEDGWTATLHEAHAAKGDGFRDVLAQLATPIAVEAGPVPR